MYIFIPPNSFFLFFFFVNLIEKLDIKEGRMGKGTRELRD